MIKFNKIIIFLMSIEHHFHNFNSPGEQNTSLVLVNIRFPHAAALQCLH